MGGPSGAKLDPVEPIAFAWNAVMKDFGGVAVPVVVATLVIALPAFVLNFTLSMLVGILTPKLDPTVATIINIGGQCVTQLLSLGLQAFMFGGLVQFTLGVCRGQKPALNVVFSGGRFFLPMLGGQLLYALGIAAGMPFCAVPAAILACGWACYQPFIVDKGLGPIEALGASWRLTQGSKGNIFLYLLLCIGVGIAGALALCVGALLVASPVVAVANAYLYLKLQGEQPRALG
jgi:hypothetical protein